MNRFYCHHCPHTMFARKRPKACGNCGKVSTDKPTNAHLGDGPRSPNPYLSGIDTDSRRTEEFSKGLDKALDGAKVRMAARRG